MLLTNSHTVRSHIWDGMLERVRGGGERGRETEGEEEGERRRRRGRERERERKKRKRGLHFSLHKA